MTTPARRSKLDDMTELQAELDSAWLCHCFNWWAKAGRNPESGAGCRLSGGQVSRAPRPRVAMSEHGDDFAGLRVCQRDSEPLESPDLDPWKERPIPARSARRRSSRAPTPRACASRHRPRRGSPAQRAQFDPETPPSPRAANPSQSHRGGTRRAPTCPGGARSSRLRYLMGRSMATRPLSPPTPTGSRPLLPAPRASPRSTA
jgi:hypothetical protein